MKGAFPKAEVDQLLVDCNRCCCICHRFCGVKIELDHIQPRGDEGDNKIENAIPICFNCHAEIHSYNDKHPRGRKYGAYELKLHKKNWLRICNEHPEIFRETLRDADVGPLQALIDELEFNLAIGTAELKTSGNNEVPPNFVDDQFRKAISLGSISVLSDPLRSQLLRTYASLLIANQQIAISVNTPFDKGQNTAINHSRAPIRAACTNIATAKDLLLKFLGHAPEQE